MNLDLRGIFNPKEPTETDVRIAQEHFEIARGYFTRAKSESQRNNALLDWSLHYLEQFFYTIGTFSSPHFNRTFYIDMSNRFKSLQENLHRCGLMGESGIVKDLARHCLYASFLEPD